MVAPHARAQEIERRQKAVVKQFTELQAAQALAAAALACTKRARILARKPYRKPDAERWAEHSAVIAWALQRLDGR